MTEHASIQALKNRHLDETAWIVGKGPSLLMLSRDHFGDGPVIALNEAIIHIESLGLDNAIYSMQKDADDYALTQEGWSPNLVSETFIPIRSATLLVHLHESPDRLRDYRPRYVFDNVADFELDWWDFSAISATAVARLMGCSKVVYVSLDACVSGDFRSCVPRTDGNFAILKTPGEEYTDHRFRIDDYLSRISMPAEWMTPGRLHGEPHGQLLVNALGRAIDRLGAQLHVRGREVDRLLSLVDAYRCGSEPARAQPVKGRYATLNLEPGLALPAAQEIRAERDLELEELSKALDACNHQVSDLSAMLDARSRELAQLSTTLDERNRECARSSTSLDAAHQRILELEAALGSREQDVAAREAALHQRNLDLDAAYRQLDAAYRRGGELESERLRVSEALNAANDRADELESARLRVSEELEAASHRLTAAELALDAANRRILNLDMEADARNRQASDLSTVLDVRNREAADLHASLDARNHELADLHRRLDDRNRAVLRLEPEVARLLEAVDAGDRELTARNAALEELRQTLEDRRHEVARLTLDRARALEELAAARAEIDAMRSTWLWRIRTLGGRR